MCKCDYLRLFFVILQFGNRVGGFGFSTKEKFINKFNNTI